MVKVTRKTTESLMEVVISPAPIKKDYRKAIVTPIPFLSHMIEHIAWRSGFNVEVKVETGEFYLTHVVCEDLGITIGKVFAEYLKQNIKNGLRGFGDAFGIIDEAKALTAISFESRAYFSFDYNNIPDTVEGMASEDLTTFLEGFVQGANCTLQIDLQKGVNAHHIWEAIFRAFGLALGEAIKIREDRKDMTAGVAGDIEFIIE